MPQVPLEAPFSGPVWAGCSGVTLVELPCGEGGSYVADFVLPDAEVDGVGGMAAVAVAMPAA